MRYQVVSNEYGLTDSPFTNSIPSPYQHRRTYDDPEKAAAEPTVATSAKAENFILIYSWQVCEDVVWGRRSEWQAVEFPARILSSCSFSTKLHFPLTCFPLRSLRQTYAFPNLPRTYARSWKVSSRVLLNLSTGERGNIGKRWRLSRRTKGVLSDFETIQWHQNRI